MRIVLDTNVLVSALLNPRGAPASVLNTILLGDTKLLYDNRILFEYNDVLHRNQFKFPANEIAPLLEYFEAAGEFVAAEPTSREFSDGDDRPFYEVAITGKARYLITGNPRHYPGETMIISPRGFLEKLDG